MQIFKAKKPLQRVIREGKANGKAIGLVPTMGALHEGHLSLVQKASEDCDIVVVSIFVNPTQFENPDDLKKYPRNLLQDIDLLKKLDSNILVFAPSPIELYGEHIISEHFNFDGLEKVMEGKYRTGHFDGVGTIIKLFFSIITPDKAFFGEKDYQQLQIIRKLTEKAGLPVEIIGCPIEREKSGLARSSRNKRLTGLQRKKAAFIYKTLIKVREQFGTKSAHTITQWVKEEFEKYPYLKLEYFEIANTETLIKIDRKRKGNQYRAFIAAYAGDVRLIDNIPLNN